MKYHPVKEKLSKNFSIGKISSRRLNSVYLVTLSLAIVSVLTALLLLVLSLLDPNLEVPRGGIIGAYSFIPLTLYAFLSPDRDKLESKIAESKSAKKALHEILRPGDNPLSSSDLRDSMLILRDNTATFYPLKEHPEPESLMVFRVRDNYYMARVKI